MKVQGESFHSNGHIIGFRPQTQKLELDTIKIVPCQSTTEKVSFEWSNHRILSINSKVGIIKY